MKTSVIMKRQIGELPIYQRTKDGFFNGNSLLHDWNNTHREQRPKRMDEYLNQKSTIAFMEALLKSESNMRKIASSDIQILIKGKSKNIGGTKQAADIWMHPLLFLDFAMWLNPDFKVEVLRFVSDKMLEYRDKAGDAYREMASELQNLVGKDFIHVAIKRVAIGINHVIFGTHYKQVRDDYGTEDKMNELFDLEHKIAFLIKEGFIKDIEEVMSFLRKKYKQIYLN